MQNGNSGHETENDGYAGKVKEELKEYLMQYMESQAIEFKGAARGSFKCPNQAGHSNGDRNFSGAFQMHSEGAKWKCFKCSEGGDIYEMAHFVEGLPKGASQEFYTVTIPAVAETVGYPIDEERYFKSLNQKSGKDMTRKPRLPRELLDEINKVIRTRQDHTRINEDFKRFNYGPELQQSISRDFQVFFPKVGDFDFLPEDHPFRDEKNKIIRDDVMAVPIHSRYGSLLGFIGRRSVKLEEQNYTKYIYSDSIDPKERLNVFNLHQARPEVQRSGLVFIFESQFDCMVAYSSGIKNAISTGSTPDPDVLSRSLKEMKCKEVVLVLDRDKAGVEASVRLYEMLIDRNLVVTIYELPEGKDADEYIVENGPDRIKDPGKRIGIIEYIIHNNYGELGNEALSENAKYNYAIEYVVRFSRNLAMASQYSEYISERFGTRSPNDVHFDITKEMKNHRDPLVKRCNDLISQSMNDIIEDPDIERKISSVDSLNEKMKDIFTTHVAGSQSEERRELDELLTHGDESDRGLVLTGIQSLDNAVRLYPGTLVVMSGRPSVGKSTLVRALVPLMHQANDDIYIIHLSLDDTTRDTTDGIISSVSEIPNDVLESNRIGSRYEEALASAHDTFREWWMKSYYMCGQQKINTIEDIKLQVEKVRIVHGKKKKVILIVDNLMNLSEIATSAAKDKRAKVEHAVNELHQVTQTRDIITFCMVEFTKSGTYRPNLGMLKETGTIEYRAKIVGLLHNDLKSNPNSKILWRDPAHDQAFPILEVEFPKYKTGDPNRRIFLKMNPAINRLNECSGDEIKRFENLILTEDGPASGGGNDSSGGDSLE